MPNNTLKITGIATSNLRKNSGKTYFSPIVQIIEANLSDLKPQDSYINQSLSITHDTYKSFNEE